MSTTMLKTVETLSANINNIICKSRFLFLLKIHADPATFSTTKFKPPYQPLFIQLNTEISPKIINFAHY